MSQIEYRANLASDNIPLLSQLLGRTVIVGKNDQDYELEVNSSSKLQKEKSIAQAYYVHNVMPTGQGYQSVGYTQKIAPFAPAVMDFTNAYVLRDVDENKSLYSPAAGKNYIWDRNYGVWRSVNPIVGHENALVTVAYLSGETYIFYEKLGCFKYDKVTGTIISVVLIGLVVTNINGICAANGFLLAWDDLNNVYRSQANTPLNFTPDPALGSGVGIPEDIRGKIVILLPITNGFIVYTTANAVAAVFQQNIRYPFIYREIEGSSGILSGDHVSWRDNLGEHYAWTISGLQKVNKSKAVPINPEITDFLIAKIFEDYNYLTDNFEITKLTTQLSVHVTVVGSRYVIISYGITKGQFTHAIVIDLAFKRFGKLRVDHVDCFTYAVPNLSGDITWEMLGDLTWDDLGDTTWADFATQLETQETPKEIIAFLKNNGTVSTVNFDSIHTGDQAVLVLGKYQFVRERLLVLDNIHVENIEQEYTDFTIKHFISLDGKNTAYKTDPYLAIDTGTYRKYNTIHPYRTGINHTIVAKGTFHLTMLVLDFHLDGRA